jgi:hypothetical protein
MTHPINWQTPAGQLLDQVASALPLTRPWTITVFGSSPLQLMLDGAFLSADVDIIGDEEISRHLEAAGLGKGQRPYYVEVLPDATFIRSPDWLDRAQLEQRGHVLFRFPSALDILIAKIKRMEAKDLAAYRLVREKTSHPTEEELIQGLQNVLDVFRPAFDEESTGDAIANTRILWRDIFGKDIDVHAQIIRPKLEELRKAYGESIPVWKPTP